MPLETRGPHAYIIYTLNSLRSDLSPPPNFEERNPQAFWGLWPLETRGPYAYICSCIVVQILA